MSLIEKIKQETKTRKELMQSRKEDLKQFKREVTKAYGGVAVASANARFQQKDNEEWIKVKDVLKILSDEKERE